MSAPTGLVAALAGRYRIERELGAGGMATVYLAEDIKHHRQVALKVLHAALSAVLGPERFLAEIQLTASLQHPHILPLFDSGEAEGDGRTQGSPYLYYVMPFVEGETLRKRLQRERQLSIEDAVRITREVADALGHAHQHGVVHRDIKPENILLQGGHALVTDFGIALAVEQAGGERITQSGISIGTPQYMSPEQATADPVITHRSDLYSLGAVLYEMLTGTPPFTGATAQQLLRRIASAEPPPIATVRKAVPPHVEAAVMKALEKVPADRFASAADFTSALKDTRYTPRGAIGVTAARRGTRAISTRALAGWVVAAVTAGAALWGWLRPMPTPPELRYAMTLPPAQRLTNPHGTRIAISPDGAHLLYTGPGPEGGQLWLRSWSDLAATPIPGTAGALNPTFSPDGERIVFTNAITSTISVATLTGAPPVTVTNGPTGADGLTWSADGYLYYDGDTRGGTTGLMRVRATGGIPEQIATVDTAAGEVDHFWPQALPDGRGVLFTIQKRNLRDGDEVVAWDAKTGEVRRLIRGLTARYATSGYLLYVSAGGELMATPFDINKLRISGKAFELGNRVGRRPYGAVDLALSATGTLVYDLADQVPELNQIVLVSKDGRANPVDSGWVGNFTTLALSPDAQRLAVSVIDGAEEQVWIKELPRGSLSKLTFGGVRNYRPTWTPSGDSLAFIGNVLGPEDRAFVIRADGSAQASPLLLPKTRQVSLVEFTPDGRSVIYRTSSPRDIFRVRLGMDTVGMPLMATSFEELDFDLSPDGKWLAYSSNESGRFEVYVGPYPDAQSARWLVSTKGGVAPRWAHSERNLFLIGLDGALTSVPILAGETFVAGERHPLFNMLDYVGGPNSYAVMPGDSQFVMIRAGAVGEATDQLVVVENIFPELEAKRVR